ncbi:hypothetical protein [Conexibacter sp. CPCC 206217]|uniref:hypothetical protein n=1 Tax=Conexibacter sp. CPCC 206217 TaxID=3064574 RepID=UPI00271DD883|nr:hypothetical protein [Conexibacter sp. CPCC 206217]MDO8208941.1 hypothetical protein [Conexibacter sp. CPCC 206217]
MTADRAKETFVGLWIIAWVVVGLTRLVGIDADGVGWRIVALAMLAVQAVLGVSFLVLWSREQRSEGRLWSELRLWAWSLGAILTIGGTYALLLEVVG